jgi:serine/threonine protein kinase
MIIEMLGTPSNSELDLFDTYSEEIKSLFAKKSRHRSGKDNSLDKVLTGHSAEAIDLVKKMLIFDPRKRITVKEALNHPYLTNLHCEEDEPESEPLSPFDFDFEIYDIKKEDYKDLIYEEIMLYHSEEALLKYINDK